VPALSAPLTRFSAIEVGPASRSHGFQKTLYSRVGVGCGSVKQRMMESRFRVSRRPPTAVHVLVACVVLSGAMPLLLPVDFAPRCAGKT